MGKVLPTPSPSSFIWICRSHLWCYYKELHGLAPCHLLPGIRISLGRNTARSHLQWSPTGDAPVLSLFLSLLISLSWGKQVSILACDLTWQQASRGEEESCVIPTTMNRLTPTYYQQNTTSPFLFRLHPLNLYLIINHNTMTAGSLYSACISKLCTVQ